MRNPAIRTILAVAIAVAVIIVAPAAATAASDGTYTWVWQNPIPNGHMMYSTSAASSTAVWSVGAYGVVLFWNGSTLVEQASGTPNDLYGVSALDATHVWAVGEGGTIRFFNGTSWSAQTSPTGYALNSVSAADATHVWAVGGRDGFNDAVILFYDGSTWSIQQSFATGGFTDVCAFNASNVWAVGGVDGWTWYYNGTIWSQVNDGSVRAPYQVSAYSTTGLFAVDWDGTILSSVDGGTTWNASLSGQSWPASVTCTAANRAWAVGWGGVIQYYNGATWATQTSGTTNDLWDIDAVNATTMYATGDARFQSSNGTTWTNRTGSLTANPVYGVSALDADRVWTCGAGGAVYYTSDGGNVWGAQASGTGNALRGIDAVDATHVWAVGAARTYRFYNGSAWSGGALPGTSVIYYGVSGCDINNVWAVGASGNIRFWNGSAWSTPASGTTNALYGVKAVDTTHVWAVGATSTVRFWNGSAWSGQAPGGAAATYYAVTALDDTHAWAVGTGGNIRFYNGSSWSTQASGTTQTLYGVSAADATHVWAVGANGTILFFDGSTWSAQTAPVGLGTTLLRAVDAYDTTDCWATGATGTIIFADPPYIRRCTPGYANPGDTVSLEITGGYTNFLGTGLEVSLGSGVDVVPGTVDVVDDLHVTCDAQVDAGAALGPRDVNVTTVGETPLPLEGGFVVGSQPTVASVDPARASRGWNGDIAIVGSQTNFGATSRAEFGSGVTVNSLSVADPEHATANVTVSTGASPGARDVNVKTGAETPRALAGGFVVANPPAVAGLSPSTGTTGTKVRISGSRFGSVRGQGNGKPVSIVKFNGVPVATYDSWSDGSIVCRVPRGDVGGPVTVETPDGLSNTDRDFHLPASSTYWYLAEGSTAWGFDTTISVENPNPADVTARLTFMTPGGTVRPPDVRLPAFSVTTLAPKSAYGLETDFSTKVECPEGREIAVDRTMTWTGPGAPCQEAHSSVGVRAPAKKWYLPEGSTAWGFECWLLVQNPGSKKANCSVTYMIEGAGPRTVTREVAAGSRATFDVRDDIGEADASMMVVSDVPVIPERAMYRNNRREGHDSIGTTTPAKNFYLAEGTTAWGFTTYVLVQNPNDTPATVTMSYMTPSGGLEDEPFTMPANSRRTLRLNDLHPDTDLSTKVHATVPIVAERSMFWNGGPDMAEVCHDSVGVSSPNTSFYLPGGRMGDGCETWTLIQNTNSADVEVEVAYFGEGGNGNATFKVKVAANSRVSLNLAEHFSGTTAGIRVRCLTPGKQVIAERATYWNSRGTGTGTIGASSD